MQLTIKRLLWHLNSERLKGKKPLASNLNGHKRVNEQSSHNNMMNEQLLEWPCVD